MIQTGRLIVLISVRHSLVTSCFWRFCGFSLETDKLKLVLTSWVPFSYCRCCWLGSRILLSPVSDFQALVASTTESTTPLWQQSHLLFLINRKISIAIVEIAFRSKLERQESQRGKTVSQNCPDAWPRPACLCSDLHHLSLFGSRELGWGTSWEQKLLGTFSTPVLLLRKSIFQMF